jgi:hypothetical protein
MGAGLLKTLALGILFGGAISLAGQTPGSFRTPIVGYIQDLQVIRPIVGIPGSARIAGALDLGIAVRDAVFLPDQRHAIVASPDAGDVLVVDLEQPSRSFPIADAPSSVSAIRAGRDGKSAGLYYSQSKRLLVVKGLPEAPAIHASVDVSFAVEPLKQFAVSEDGGALLLVFGSGMSDLLYSWTPSGGPRFVATASRVSDLIFLSSDAVVVDSLAEQVILIQAVRDRAVPLLLATSSDGLAAPVAVSASVNDDIYVASSDAVFILNARGRLLRKVACSCTITTMTPLSQAAFRMTSRLDEPLFVFDGSAPERIVFVPALSPQATGNPE